MARSVLDKKHYFEKVQMHGNDRRRDKTTNTYIGTEPRYIGRKICVERDKFQERDLLVPLRNWL